MIPKKPKIRPLEAFPLSNSDKYPIGLRDPTYQAGNILAVTPGTLLLISLMNGERDLKTIQEEFVRRTKTLVTSEDMERLVYTLDQYYFLDSPRFHKYQQFLREEFSRSPVRAMFHAHFLGESAEHINEFFSRYFDTEEEPFPFSPRAVICPHIDYQRGKRAYNAIFPRLPPLDSSSIVFFLGVAHFEEKEQPFYATLKDFETPFGIVPVAKDAVEIIAESANFPIFEGEFCHRFEHSIELVLLMIKWKFPTTPFSIVPILCGSFDRYFSDKEAFLDSEEKVQSALEGMRKLVKEKNPIIFACVDFSHIGAKFGWDKPVEISDLRALELYERELLSYIEKGNPRDFISCISRKRNATNLDAVGAIYTLLHILPSPRFRLLHYEISYEEATASAVSFASLVAF